jgi:3-oxoacyl-[acyl-carrier protein] reductase
MTGTLSDAQKDQIVRRTPIRRLGVPADCTGAIAYLLGDESSYVTGQTFVLDGGVTI